MFHHFRGKFLAGVFAAIPIAVTAFVIWYVETTTRNIIRVDIPFLGVLIALIAIYLLGLLVTSLLGKWLLGLLDRLLSKIPGLKQLYTAWKQVVVTPGGSSGVFTKVVLVRDETGHLTIGFTAGTPIENDPNTTCVFVPAAPNPTAGRLYFTPMSACRFIDVEPEEAFKLILSGGNYIPPEVGLTTARAAAPG